MEAVHAGGCFVGRFDPRYEPGVQDGEGHLMADYFAPHPGVVLSADIAVPDHARELRFYQRVLGTGPSPLWRDDLTNNLGMPVIGVGARSAEYAELPLQWMPHIQVDDIAASITRALDLDGRELLHSRDDDGTSQWAVLLDPNGAAFGLIPLIAPDAIPPVEPPSDPAAPVGRIAWLDLTVADAGVTRDFYHEVIGWSVHEIEMDDSGERYVDYGMLSSDGTPRAGVCHARGLNAGLPPVWLLYLAVGDLEESLRRVREEGGDIIKTMQGEGEDGAAMFVAVRDPVGACVALMQG